MAVKAAFIGACGATLRHVLAWTLLDGHKAAALVRDHSKLKKILLDLGVSEKIQQSQLIVVEGSSRDVTTVRNLLLNDPEIIFSGITSTWKLRFNPFHPIAMDDASITGDSAAAVMQALKDLVSTNSITNLPIYAPISSTGHGSRRDQPRSLMPLYWWLLKEAQADTAVLERVTREAATQKQSCLGGYVMLRPPLLTDGEMKGTKEVRAGWIWEDDIFRKSDEQETGVKIACDIDPKGPEKHSDRRRDLVILDHHDDDDPIEAACICTNRSFDVAGIIGLYASCMAQNSKATEDASVVSGIEVKATKPAATVTSGAITTTAAASATEAAGNSAGKMTGSIMAVTWVNLMLLFVL
ncbi:uncharacterized protein FOBCDRAFT_243141 [Fusarium oxysporum Fo47]|uniref:uncharacterized protein n=1 Tax=Fusarium oxysporum Fo47 TaxID=660027 RepID=UPI002869EB24|nr:uncharacterized protein FOBCDRAFT_243141 [Fusarium oxysporum Fo47]QKD59148.2 hypothetical protein FOBCDRAFT_243141 [Fusarium oxysporum Fo47]